MHHLIEHWGDVLAGVMGGATLWGIAGHAVSTFPPPDNPYGQWLLGVIQFAVGQRNASKNTMQGLSSTITATPK